MKRISDFINSLTGRLSMVVLLGMLLISVAVSSVVLYMSSAVFTDTYGASQEKVFTRIETEYNSFHDSLTDIMEAIDSSWAFRLFLDSEEEMDNISRFRNIYQMEADLEASKGSGMKTMNILVLGRNGRHYLSRTETITMDDESIWQSEAVKEAVAEPEVIHYRHSHGAFTATARDRDVVTASKALYYQETGDIYAVVIITLTQDDLRKYYDYFLTDYSSFYMTDSEGIVLCSDVREDVGRPLEKECIRDIEGREGLRFVTGPGRSTTVLRRHLAYPNCTIYGIVDNSKALGGMYDMSLLISICVGIALFVLFLSMFFTRRVTLPIARMADKMSMVRKGDFMEYVPVEGTTEVKDLAITYNYMLDDIKNYIDKLMDTQQEKRAAEIKALQMQINPHYIYNTLASIKWMIYSNERERTIKMIDAFISLLRNTISNADEFITIRQETENLRNYILINRIRYGDSVEVVFDVGEECMECRVPKLVYQPFVENAFFHAFPSQMKGRIDIIMKTEGDSLVTLIEDNGIGMEQSKADMVVKSDTAKEHFSGIGIHNVKDRLALLYGDEASVVIESSEGRGTRVMITLPVSVGTMEDDDGKGEDR